jgi:hypothetical protein
MYRHRTYRALDRGFREVHKQLRSLLGRKYFCVGFNKTGTTSVKKAFQDLGFIVGHQPTAEALVGHYKQGNWKPIVSYCRSAQAFQDVPFSLPETFLHLDAAFPRSKFILTVRDTPDQWYESLVGFHSEVFGGGKVPTKADLQRSNYRRPGWAAELLSILPEDDLYNRDLLLAYYNSHNESVMSHFSERQEDLLVLNVADPHAYEKFCSFVGVASVASEGAFPWENRTSARKVQS